MNDNLSEEWRAIPGYEGVYEVSNIGRVRRIAAIGSKGRPKFGNILTSNSNNPGGYERVTLSLNGKARIHTVHSLVLESFTGPRPVGSEGCHGSSGKSVNSTVNLRWGTKAENIADRYENNEIARGERNGSSKLAAQDIIDIRARYRSEPLISIANDYGVTAACICSIGKRRNWGHIN